MLALITARISAEAITPSARAIAAAIGRMITAGDLPPDTKLPTVRQLSRALGVSPTTVSEAWRGLAAVGAIETRGRNGTFVQLPTGPGGPRRYRRITQWHGRIAIDLSTGTPDPELLPNLGPAIASVGRQTLTTTYLDAPVLPELDELLRADWPFPPEAMTVVDGAMDALDRVAQVVLRLGDRVVVEHPAFPPLLDLLDQLGCQVIGVDVGDDGLDPAALSEALALRPTAVFLQPRAHNPTGVAMSERRAAELATILADSAAWVIEDDHANEVSGAPLTSIGRWLPQRTVHVRSFSKSHGPDLRLAAVGGAGEVVEAVANRRLLGPGWSSRILQHVLVQLLDSDETRQTLAAARATYDARRAALSDVLRGAGIEHPDGDGINMWVAVEDERAALVLLASHGIGAAPGAPFQTRPDRDFLRLTIGRLHERDIDHVAGVLVEAAGHPRARTETR